MIFHSFQVRARHQSAYHVAFWGPSRPKTQNKASDRLAAPAWRVHRRRITARSSADSRSLFSPYRSVKAQMAKQNVIASTIRLGMPRG